MQLNYGTLAAKYSVMTSYIYIEVLNVYLHFLTESLYIHMTRYCEYIMDTMKTDSFYLVRFQPMAAIAIHGIYIHT